MVESNHTVEQEVEQHQADELLRNLCRSLEQPYRSVSEAYYLKGFTASEIAKRTGVNQNTVKTQLRRARKQMQTKWKEVYGDGRTLY